ncbi:MAG: NAD(P)/FAD-dependent oxidoreductase [Theionarchaea archaeon]|nr:NAD(P)/FAD-dependent oxidoreductase [Theionarchaea archaeon]
MEVIISGGGITGCYAGELLKKKGIDPIIIEEHPNIGTPVQCAGLIGKETVESCKLPFPRQVIVNHIHGARFWLQREWFEIERKGVAFVIDRSQLDRYFSHNLEIHTDERVIGLKKEEAIPGHTGSQMHVTTQKGTYDCDVVLGCDGPFSCIRKADAFSLDASYYPGGQYIMDLAPDSDFIEVHIRPPFFIWMIPETDETTRIGYVGPNPFHELNRFLEKMEIRASILHKQAGVIPIGKGDIAHRRVALIGDAACQVKPMTGGGIFYGMKAAELAVHHLSDLTRYEKAWKNAFGKEISAGLKMRKVYESLDVKNLKRVFRVFKEQRDLIETTADFERHTSLLKVFMKHPVLLRLAGAYLKEFIT